MIAYITSNLSTIAVAFVLALVLAAIVRNIIVKRKKGISSCGGSCSGCAMGCHRKEE